MSPARHGNPSATCEMPVVVLGCGGMLGHKLLERLSGRLTVFGTVRDEGSLAVLRRFYGDVALERVFTGVNALEFASVTDVLAQVRPRVVVAVGRIGDPLSLPADLRRQELALRQRRPLGDLLLDERLPPAR